MQYKVKVRYVIIENFSHKILYIRLDEIDSLQLNLIGQEIMKLQKNYTNSYVLIKVFNEEMML